MVVVRLNGFGQFFYGLCTGLYGRCDYLIEGA